MSYELDTDEDLMAYRIGFISLIWMEYELMIMEAKDAHCSLKNIAEYRLELHFVENELLSRATTELDPFYELIESLQIPLTKYGND